MGGGLEEGGRGGPAPGGAGEGHPKVGGPAPLLRELSAVLCACAYFSFVCIPARNERVKQGVALALRRSKEMNVCNFPRGGPALTLKRAFSAFFPGRLRRPGVFVGKADC